MLSGLGILEWSEGRPAKAIPIFEKAINLQRQTGDRLGLGKHLVSAVASYVEVKRISDASDALKEGKQILESSGDALDQWSLLIGDGIVATASNRLDAARQHFREAVKCADQIRDAASKSRALLWLSFVECQAEQNELSAQLLGAMRAAGSESNTQLYPANEIRAASIEGILIGRLREDNFRRLRFFGEISRIDDLLRDKA